MAYKEKNWAHCMHSESHTQIFLPKQNSSCESKGLCNGTPGFSHQKDAEQSLYHTYTDLYMAHHSYQHIIALPAVTPLNTRYWVISSFIGGVRKNMLIQWYFWFVCFSLRRNFANLKLDIHLYQNLKEIISTCRHDLYFSFLNDTSERTIVCQVWKQHAYRW